ncbi:MAG: serine hydrolase [Micrococcus sp.]|nr:serine hydrolase [Micrococcus sp.]
MAEHRSPRRLAAGVLSLQDITTSAPALRFAVRFTGGPYGSAGSEAPGGDPGEVLDAAPDGVHHDAGSPHPLAGTGKLFLAVAVARLADRDPGLLARPLTVRGEHRAAARSGTLRRMTGDLQLTVDDAMALIVGTGDGACTVALLELLATRDEDVVAEANRTATRLGLRTTTFAGLETTVPGPGGEGDVQGESWGEGLIGATSPADLGALLVQIVRVAASQKVTSAGLSAPAHDGARGSGHGPETPSDPPLSAAVADRVLGWMGKAFEPAGLAGALPGFGPRTIPHWTVSGLELLDPPGAPGCASVLILPADVGAGRSTACVAAFHPRTRAEGSTVSARELSAILGSLGLAAARTRAATEG